MVEDRSVEENICRMYERSLKSLDEDVENLKNWIETQPHLPEVPDDKLIRNFLFLAKFSIEKVKTRLDMYYTIRSLIPEFFRTSWNDPKMLTTSETACYTLMGIVPETCEIVTWYSLVDDDVDKFDSNDVTAHILQVAEIRMREVSYSGEIAVLDVRKYGLGHIAKVTPVLMKKLHLLLTKVYGLRFSAIHVVHEGAIVDGMVAMAKMLMPEKISKRITVHRSIDSLKEHLSPKYIPKDFGGEQPTLAELTAMTAKKKEQNKELLEKLSTLGTNEELRPEKLVNDDFLGMYGNFKKLDVD